MKDKILELRAKGYTYKQIAEELGCAKSTVAYYCGEGQKQKSLDRKTKHRLLDPLSKKVYTFKERKPGALRVTKEASEKRGLAEKVRSFQRRILSKLGPSNNVFTPKDVLELYDGKPVCYLTGVDIDLSNPSSYQLDHIIPASKGGTNEITNLGFLVKEVNQAKKDMLVEEFLQMCLDVVIYNGLVEEYDRT